MYQYESTYSCNLLLGFQLTRACLVHFILQTELQKEMNETCCQHTVENGAE